MAARLSTGGEQDDLVETHEINVTPFIDVILVLLIIFMVAAPLSTVDVHVDLPASSATPVPRPEKPLFVTLKADRAVALGDDTVARDTLGAALDKASEGDKEKRVFVRADKTASYGDVMELMNLLRTSGYLKIGLVGLDVGKHVSPASGVQQP
jgi:biopolymer transport protein ExbD